MRIAYLSDSTLPSHKANSVHVAKMVSAMVEGGHDLTLYCYASGAEAVGVGEYYDLRHEFSLFTYPETRFPGARRLLRMLAARTLSMDKYDLIYARDLHALVAAHSSQVPMCFEAHTPPQSAWARWALARLLRSPHFRRLVVISEALKQRFLQDYPWLDDELVLVAHDGADYVEANAATATREIGGRIDAVQIGYVGSLYPGKGADVVRDLAPVLPDVDFHVVGGTPSELDAFVVSKPPTNLYLHGQVPHAEVPGYLRRFDIALFPLQERVLLPSGVDIGPWTSPLKLFEFMAAGLPIIGSDLPIVREVLKNGQNALLVAANDLTAWSSAVKRLRVDPTLRSRLGAAAQADLVNQYTWERRAAMVLKGV
ncbi:MAG: glycosyltransferase family 4 protein [Pseudomonadota bacterium]